MRRGGQALLRERFKPESIQRVERAYARFGFLAIAIPAILPPPLPFKIFVATAGTLNYPRWKFLTTVMLARSFRYYVEGILAVFYGRRVLLFMKDNGLVILSAIAAVALIGLLVYVVVNRLRTSSLRKAAQTEKSQN
jgi:membrane protein DedA with SNARE-associated domain